ncbi:MAG: hypothetical protein B7Y39_01890 [Bdellovibrio sp. 28-41-41]|nr:MAG: hypothetical protein B7Y39_01890 [Bdellovibrio sp. 28-41-41]
MRKKLIAAILSITLFFSSRSAKADLFGGDVVILTQILAQAIQTVITLKSVLETGKDSLDLMRDINAGVRSGLDLIRIINPKFNPGVYGDLRNADAVLRALQAVYGPVPTGMDQDLMKSQDQSVAEVISMNRNLYDYADQVDREKDRILFHAQVVSPQGAGKLQNQALGVLIGVMTQLLRIQSQMLKIMGQNMAYDNRKEKIATQNFKENYQSLSHGFGSLPRETKLPRIGGDK